MTHACDHLVTVISLTRKRQQLIERAIRSVQRQECQARVLHLVLVDDCLDTFKHLTKRYEGDSDVKVWFIPRLSHEGSGVRRVARLRNIGRLYSMTEWVGFLDDDNEYEPNHLQSLLECAMAANVPAAHSYMQIFYQDGLPYLEPRLPWCRDDQTARQLYDGLVRAGVFERGSNIVRDRADTIDHPNPVRTVDMGEWLFRRDLLHRFPFDEEYSPEDICAVRTEDDKLLQALVEARVRIACTQLATLRYYLGGYSNAFLAGSEHSKETL